MPNPSKNGLLDESGTGDKDAASKAKDKNSSDSSSSSETNSILAACKIFQDKLMADKAAGISWEYRNPTKYTEETWEATLANNKHACNCALLARWALKKAGYIPDKVTGNFYGVVGDLRLWGGWKDAMEQTCDIYEIKTKTVGECISDGSLHPGDILTYMIIGHTNIYAGGKNFYDAGHAYCIPQSGEGAIFQSWYGKGIYDSYKIGWVIRPKGSGSFGLGIGSGNYMATIDFLTPQFFMLGDPLTGEGISESHDNSIDPPGMGKSKSGKANTSSDGKAQVEDGSGQGAGTGTPGLDAAIERLKEFLKDRYDADLQRAVGELQEFYGKDLGNLSMEEAVEHLKQKGLIQDKDKSESVGDLQQDQSMQDSLDRLEDFLTKPTPSETYPERPGSGDSSGSGGGGGQRPQSPLPGHSTWGPQDWNKPDLEGEPEEEEPPSNWGPLPGTGNETRPEPAPPGSEKMRRRILIECAKFEELMKNDRIHGRIWRYAISNNYFTKSLNDMIQAQEYRCNEYMFVNWMLQNIKVTSASNGIFYNDGSKPVFTTSAVQTELYRGCDFLNTNATLGNLQDDESVIPGDIVLLSGSSEMLIYGGNNVWFDGGLTRCIAGIFVWLSGRAMYLNSHVYGVLRLKEEEVTIS